MSVKSRRWAGYVAIFVVVGGCGSDNLGGASEAVVSTPPTAVEVPTTITASWCDDFLVFDEQPTVAAIPAITETAPAEIRADLEVLRQLLEAVSNFDDDEPGGEVRLADLRNEPDNRAATESVNTYVDANC